MTKCCLKASSDQAVKLYDYCMKMEDIINKYCKHATLYIKWHKKKLQLEYIETNQLLK